MYSRSPRLNPGAISAGEELALLPLISPPKIEGGAIDEWAPKKETIPNLGSRALIFFVPNTYIWVICKKEKEKVSNLGRLGTWQVEPSL